MRTCVGNGLQFHLLDLDILKNSFSLAWLLSNTLRIYFLKMILDSSSFLRTNHGILWNSHDVLQGCTWIVLVLYYIICGPPKRSDLISQGVDLPEIQHI